MSKHRIHIEGETPEQRKARYRHNKERREAKARAARRREIEENRTAGRRLSFLASLIHAVGLNMAQAGELCGISQQSMSWMFSVADDCLLSKAERILRKLGFILSVELKNKNICDDPDRSVQNKTKPATLRTDVNDGVEFRIEGTLLDEMHIINPKMPWYVNECRPEDRMYFLAEYLPTCGMRITDLMRRCAIDMTSLRNIFTNDDIKISQIFKIAKATGGIIIWKIE